jgi:hypothetical protein
MVARWLARHVGPTQVRPCRRRVKGHVIRCHRSKPPLRSVLLPHASQDLGATARLAGDTAIATTAAVSTGSSTLQLVRSFDIPTDDPSYVRLLNWSWTYDSAMTATAFVVSGYSSEAQQLLDQLAALQHTDGSIEIAFNVADGTAEPAGRARSRRSGWPARCTTRPSTAPAIWPWSNGPPPICSRCRERTACSAADRT